MPRNPKSRRLLPFRWTTLLSKGFAPSGIVSGRTAESPTQAMGAQLTSPYVIIGFIRERIDTELREAQAAQALIHHDSPKYWVQQGKIELCQSLKATIEGPLTVTETAPPRPADA